MGREGLELSFCRCWVRGTLSCFSRLMRRRSGNDPLKQRDTHKSFLVRSVKEFIKVGFGVHGARNGKSVSAMIVDWG